ncbi:Glutathione hydrolase 3-like protein [Drosera capensis]
MEDPLQDSIESPLLYPLHSQSNSSNQTNSFGEKRWSRALLIFSAMLTISIVSLVLGGNSNGMVVVEEQKLQQSYGRIPPKVSEIVESEKGVVPADDARCSEVGASMLRKSGHAVGVDMYEKNPEAKSGGALSMGVPGEIAGLYEAWLSYHGAPYLNPPIKLARGGFVILPYLGHDIVSHDTKIRADLGLSQVFAPNGVLLQTGETCRNIELANSLEAVAEHGPGAFYGGEVGQKLVSDVRKAGGILTVDDLRNYKVQITDALSVNVMGYTLMGMPPSLIPNYVLFENWTVIKGNHIELPEERQASLEARGHKLKSIIGGAICQLVVQTMQNSTDSVLENSNSDNTMVFKPWCSHRRKRLEKEWETSSHVMMKTYTYAYSIV